MSRQLRSEQEEENTEEQGIDSRKKPGWIGVDLDGTLAYYDRWRGIDHIGEPISMMVDRIKNWLADGYEVRIFTARVSEGPAAIFVIEKWCQEHIGEILKVTNIKDMDMIECWDDRSVQIVTNTGQQIEVVAYDSGYDSGYNAAMKEVGWNDLPE